jgi:hypothetical protein
MNKEGERSIQCNKTKEKAKVTTNKAHNPKAHKTKKKKKKKLLSNSQLLTIKH